MRSRHAIVVGGGIGGLATALSVSRNGFDVTVLERSEEFVELGAGLQLAPNATRRLGAFGLLDQVVEAGVLLKRIVLASALTGEELTWLGLERFRSIYGGPYLVVHRNDLLAILLQACKESPHVELLPSKHVVEVDPGDGGAARCACSDESTFEGSVLIGADGLHSLVRGLISDDEPICSGYVAYRGAVPIQKSARPASLDDEIVFIGPGIHFVQYPLRRGEVYNQVAVFRSERYAAGEQEWGTPDELDHRFAGACEHVRDALTSIERQARWPMYDRLPLDRWSVGNVVLLGDAAHPMLQYLAQGACQAIVDASVLGTELGRVAAGEIGVREALASYERARRPVTSRVQRHARLWGELWHGDGMFASLRDAYLRDRDPADLRYVDPFYAAGTDTADDADGAEYAAGAPDLEAGAAALPRA